MKVQGRPGFVLSKTGEETVVYRWRDPDSATLLARFEDGKLTRKSVIAALDAKSPEEKTLSEADYQAVTPGMTLDEVLVLIGMEPKSQNEGRDGASMLRWADSNGSSFIARFQDGKLVRKTGFHVSRKQEDQSEAPEVPAAPPEAIEEPPVEVASATEVSEAPTEPEADTPAPGKRPRVRSTSTASRDGERKGSYNPKAKLPDFAHSLRQGSFEIRVTNPTDSEVKAGLRLNDRGTDLTVPPGASRSMKVDRGAYKFYFVSESDPYTLNGGGSVDLNGMFATDLEISIIDEDYEVRALDATP